MCATIDVHGREGGPLAKGAVGTAFVIIPEVSVEVLVRVDLGVVEREIHADAEEGRVIGGQVRPDDLFQHFLSVELGEAAGRFACRGSSNCWTSRGRSPADLRNTVPARNTSSSGCPSSESRRFSVSFNSMAGTRRQSSGTNAC